MKLTRMVMLSIALSVGVAAEPVSANAPRGERAEKKIEKKSRIAKKGKKAAKPKPKAEPAPKADEPAAPAEATAPVESAPSAPTAVDPVDTGGGEGLAPDMRRNGPSRIEFDDRLIQGQTNKANAIYLFERRASELRTLVRTRKDYHREIDESLD